MRKHIDMWIPAEMHKKIKEMSFEIYKQNPDEHDPMSKALEIVLSWGFDRLDLAAPDAETEIPTK